LLYSLLLSIAHLSRSLKLCLSLSNFTKAPFLSFKMQPSGPSTVVEELPTEPLEFQPEVILRDVFNQDNINSAAKRQLQDLLDNELRCSHLKNVTFCSCFTENSLKVFDLLPRREFENDRSVETPCVCEHLTDKFKVHYFAFENACYRLPFICDNTEMDNLPRPNMIPINRFNSEDSVKLIHLISTLQLIVDGRSTATIDHIIKVISLRGSFFFQKEGSLCRKYAKKLEDASGFTDALKICFDLIGSEHPHLEELANSLMDIVDDHFEVAGLFQDHEYLEKDSWFKAFAEASGYFEECEDNFFLHFEPIVEDVQITQLDDQSDFDPFEHKHSGFASGDGIKSLTASNLKTFCSDFGLTPDGDDELSVAQSQQPRPVFLYHGDSQDQEYWALEEQKSHDGDVDVDNLSDALDLEDETPEPASRRGSSMQVVQPNVRFAAFRSPPPPATGSRKRANYDTPSTVTPDLASPGILSPGVHTPLVGRQRRTDPSKREILAFLNSFNDEWFSNKN
jgi:hypothetical protein